MLLLRVTVVLAQKLVPFSGPKTGDQTWAQKPDFLDSKFEFYA